MTGALRSSFMRDLRALQLAVIISPNTVQRGDLELGPSSSSRRGAAVLTEELNPLRRRQAVFVGQPEEVRHVQGSLHVLSAGEHVLEATGPRRPTCCRTSLLQRFAKSVQGFKKPKKV